MNVAIIGYGRMGKEIERILLERGHSVPLKIDIDNQEDLNQENLQNIDVAIEFTVPSSAVANYYKCFEAKVPVVSGTTGWLDKLPEVESYCANEKQGFLYASNFSLGVNLFFALNKKLAELMNPYDIYDCAMEEIHHTKKLDAPSGTAITLAEGVLKNLDRKKKWVLNDFKTTDDFQITAKRVGGVPGTHTITYDSDVDTIEISHIARSRAGFAFGVVLAAEYMAGKTGIHTMNDVLNL